MGGKKKTDKNIIEIYADFIYYVILGDKEEIDDTVKILNKNRADNYVEYLSLKTLIPLAKHKEKIEKSKHVNIELDAIVEEAQAYSYTCYDMKTCHMLVCLKLIENEYILTFPRYIMIDGDDPEKGLLNEFARLSSNKLNNKLSSTIRPLDVIGTNNDVILYVSVLTTNGSTGGAGMAKLDELLKMLLEKMI